MQQIPTLAEIVQTVERLPLARRKKAPQGRKLLFCDGFIIALAVYQKLASFRYSQQMLAVLGSLEVHVPAPSTFAERKALLLGQIILAVKYLGAGVQATKQHIDSKKLEVVDFAPAKRTSLPGAYGRDHVYNSTFYGFRLHARVDDSGDLCDLLLRPANEHDVRVAPRLLENLVYTIVTGDKGYLSQELKADLAANAVDLVTPRKSNQLPPPEREKVLYQGHRMVESVFSSLDGLGLSDRPYRSTVGFLLHVYTAILAYQLFHSEALEL